MTESEGAAPAPKKGRAKTTVFHVKWDKASECWRVLRGAERADEETFAYKAAAMRHAIRLKRANKPARIQVHNKRRKKAA